MRALAIILSGLAISLLAAAASSDNSCLVNLKLTDAATGSVVPGLVQIRNADGKLVELPTLLSRGFGLEPGTAIHEWHVVAGPVQLGLPRGSYQLKALSGLETELAEQTLDLTGSTAEITVPLHRFYDAAAAGLRSANTHLHLKKLSRGQADRYLTEVPRADGLDVLFLSYLERAIENLEYTSNKYTQADLDRLSTSEMRLGNGEEHRHNFLPQNQGYGHVMLLNIPELIQPVSIGPGITKQGTDGLPLRQGIEKARSLGGTIVWCHNQWGLEDIPNWVMGRLQANNIFDGGTHGSFKHSFYRYLNIGLHVPFSTGTDWFMYDFSRVYVPAKERISPEEWLKLLVAGKSWITNGPLIEFTVDGKTPGEIVDLKAAGEVKLHARIIGRVDFQRLELVRNGVVEKTAPSRRDGGHFVAELDEPLRLDAPAWLALRTPPPPVKTDPEFQQPVPKNELGCDLFGHTSAVYVQIAGRKPFDVETAKGLLTEMLDSQRFIEEHALFADDTERTSVLMTYDEAIAKLRKEIGETQP